MTVSFRFPSNPYPGQPYYNEVTGVTYRFLSEKNSWVVAGTDHTYDDSELREEIERLEEWLKNHVADFIRVSALGDVKLRQHKQGNTFPWPDAATQTGRHFLSLGGANGSQSWVNISQWDEVEYFDISRNVLPEGKVVEWGQLIAADEGFTFYMTPVVDSVGPVETQPYAQYKIVEQVGGRSSSVYRFKVELVHSFGKFPDTSTEPVWTVRALNTIEENPAVIVRRQPVDPSAYSEGTLWFDLDSLQMNVNILDARTGGHKWIICNVPIDLNGDFLRKSAAPGESANTYQIADVATTFKRNTRFRKPTFHTHTDLDLPFFKAYTDQRKDGTPLFKHQLQNGAEYIFQDYDADGAVKNFLEVKENPIEPTKGRLLRVSSLRQPKHADDAARYQDTFDEFIFGDTFTSGKKNEVINGEEMYVDCLPGHFYIEMDGNDLRNIVHSRVDKWLRPVGPRITNETHERKMKNTSHTLQIIRHAPVQGTDEVEEIVFQGIAHTMLMNDNHYNVAGKFEGVSMGDGRRVTTHKGNQKYQFNATNDTSTGVMWFDRTKFKKGETYTLRSGALIS
nr:hypothetical protein [uncultured Mediterranean phage uvMED]